MREQMAAATIARGHWQQTRGGVSFSVRSRRGETSLRGEEYLWPEWAIAKWAHGEFEGVLHEYRQMKANNVG
jgi:hypothetical protein